MRKSKYTKTVLRRIAKRCSSKAELWSLYKSAANTASLKGWYTEIFGGLPSKRSRRLTKEDCFQAASRFRSRRAFKAGAGGAYNRCLWEGWLDEACSHMDLSQKQRPRGFWTKGKCCKIAARHESRTSFLTKDKNAYGACVRRGWLDEACSHMTKPIPIGRELLRYVYVDVFRLRGNGQRYCYIGLTYDIAVRSKEHSKRKDKYGEALRKERVRRRVSGPLPAGDAARLEKSKIAAYRKRGFKLLNINGGGSVGNAH